MKECHRWLAFKCILVNVPCNIVSLEFCLQELKQEVAEAGTVIHTEIQQIEGNKHPITGTTWQETSWHVPGRCRSCRVVGALA